MRKYLPIVLFFFFSPFLLHAQRITGFVQDSSRQGLFGATVMLIQEKDSALASFVLTNEKGAYRLTGLKPQSYILKASFLGFGQEERKVEVKAGQKEIALEPLILLPQDISLEQVDIEAEQSPIRFKDDTLEYKADVFGTQPGEVVEDLLRKLPGVEVDENGDIQAQGQRVNKVMVDGKEFFSNDPKLATKNLPADAVDKVQVFDEKTDDEDISGVDDGQVNQTINLELKEDSKKGVFGNVEGGYGTSDRYQFKGNLNRFAPKSQLSAIGLANNVNKDGFSFDEYIQFMGGLGSFMKGGSVNIELDANSGVPIEGMNQNGIFTTQGAGLNGNFDFSSKLRLTTTYQHSGLGSRRDENIRREQFLVDDFFTSENIHRQNSQFYNNRFSTNLRFRGDSIARFNLSFNAGYRNGTNFDTTATEVFGAEDNLENATERFSESRRNNIDGELRANYLTRLGKKGRTLFVDGRLSGRMDEQLGLLNSFNTLFRGGMPQIDTLSQQQDQREEDLTYGGNLKYTEPLGKKGNSISFLYSVQNFEQDQDRVVEDLFPERQLNLALSNQFRRDYLYQRGGLVLALNGKKAKFQLGADYQQSRLQGDLISLGDTSIQQSFRNILPNMSFFYTWKQGLRAGLRYRTSFREPSLVQLQPFVDNRDPFNLYQGNPGLRPSYSHSLNGDFLLYDNFSFTSLFAFVNLTYTQNPIVEAREVDSLFRQIRTPINVDNSLSLRGSINFNTPIKPLKMKVGIRINPEFNRGITFVNSVENIVNRLNNTLSVRLENRKKKVFDAAIGARLSFNNATYSEASELNRSFLNQSYYADLRINFLKNWVFRSNFDWAIYAGGNFAENIQVPLLSASISRQLFNKKLRVELEAFDILNQNKGITRRAELNFIEDGNSLTLTRYISLKLSYSIGSKSDSGMGGKSVIIDKR